MKFALTHLHGPVVLAWPRHHRRAFSMVELLVCITIIVLLVALLMPTLSSARRASQMSVSLSNLRQISVGLHMYAGDAKQSLPLGTNRLNLSNIGVPPTWAGMLRQGEYISTVRLLWSPARELGEYGQILDAMENTYWGTTAIPPSMLSVHEGWQRTGYGCNYYAMPDLHHNRAPVTLSSAKSPPHDQFLTVIEGWMELYGRTGRYEVSPRLLDNGSTPRVFTLNGAAARSYLDGHAQADASENIGWYWDNDYEGQWAYPNASAMRGEPWFANWWQ